MTKINSMKEFYNKVESGEKIVVYYYTKWCPDCFAIRPFLPKLEKEFTDFTFYKMDRDTDLELAKHLRIYGIPSFLVFDKGDEIGRYVDKFRKTYAQVHEFLSQFN